MSDHRGRKAGVVNWSSRSMYSGRILLGTVRLVRNKFEARNARRKLIGRFRSAKKALAAIRGVELPADG
jgi:hypothetical protein